MKYFIMSDIHGSEYYLRKGLKRYEQEGADYIIILGDILYHGARNDLPKDYNPKAVIELLNAHSQKIMALRGNCDSEVDQMVLDFPIMASYNNLIHKGRRIFLSHGHIYNEENLPNLRRGDCFIYGHSHILRAEKKDGIYFLNPGSLSMAKGGRANSFAVLDENHFIIKDLEGGVIDKISLD